MESPVNHNNMESQTPISPDPDSELLDEEVKIAFIREVINTCDAITFEECFGGLFQGDWETSKGPVLHGIIMPQDGNTVLHEAAMTKGALDIVKIIIEHAPFLMGKTNLYGETVWHIAAREEYHTGGLFDALDTTRLFWKKKLEATTDAHLYVNGINGSLLDLSVRAANIKNGKTALHEAVLSNNLIVAGMLVYAELEELKYKANKENNDGAVDGSGSRDTLLPAPEGVYHLYPTPARFSVGNLPPEERVVASVQKAIKAGDASAFRSSIEKVFRTDWDVLDGRVLHSIKIPEGRTVLHDAAMTKGALKIVKTVCDQAPFLMCKQDDYGETVWHIAAREEYLSRGLFDTLYNTRQLWKKRLEAADTPTLSANGVDGGMEELSIEATNFEEGNTALHVALLYKNTLVAQKLFEADKELCYKLNKGNKSPMNLALENGAGDAALFKSMFEYAAETDLGKSAINTQWSSLVKSAIVKRHQGWVTDLILSSQQ